MSIYGRAVSSGGGGGQVAYIHCVSLAGSYLSCNDQHYQLGSDETEHTFNVVTKNNPYTVTASQSIYSDSRMVNVDGPGVTYDVRLLRPFDFTYTGTYNERLDGVLELLTSGTLIINRNYNVDIFLVGGGGSGGTSRGSGAGGGYTTTVLNQNMLNTVSYTVQVGSGGTPQTSTGSGYSGGQSYIAEITEAKANGGAGGIVGYSKGGAGGSGGGYSGYTNGSPGSGGGSDGSNGKDRNGGYTGGAGQGTTTREFGESTGKLYSGGGGGAGEPAMGSCPGGPGGAGGGGRGYGTDGEAASGITNTGGGGGGTIGNRGTAGGSGIVCIRIHQDSV